MSHRSLYLRGVAGLLLLILAVSLDAQVVTPAVTKPGNQAIALAPSPWATPTADPIGTGLVGKVQKLTAPKPNVALTSLTSYLQRVRAQTTEVRPEPGSIWTENGRLARLSTDVRAMRPHDLISVVVQESLAAETDGTVKNSRASSASASLTSLFGALKASSKLTNLLGQSAASALNAGGQSATNSSLSTTFGGQVVDVLANGTLVIEAARQVEFSQQTQTIVLRGLVRPEDISQQNQVLSTAISSLELEVKGKGIVNDATYRQNPLVRFIEKLLVF